MILAAPAAAYQVTGTIASGGGVFSVPVIFTHDGSISFDFRLTSSSGFGVDTLSSIDYNQVHSYDYFDPQTGEYLGGNDNIGSYMNFESFGNDASGPDAPRGFHFKTVFPFALAYHPYVLQNSGDPYPHETGFNQTDFVVFGFAFGNADPINYILTVDGTAVVSEPASWSLMIAGFGASGLMVRRRWRRASAEA